MKKVFVSGNVMSGKNVLRKMLDGHPNVICNHIHDVLSNIILSNDAKLYFSRKKNQSFKSLQTHLKKIKIKYKSKEIISVDIGDFFYGLHHFCDYKTLMKLAESDTLYLKSKEGVMEKFPFSFNFSAFENDLKRELFNEDKIFSSEELLDIIYLSYVTNWINKQEHEEDYFFVNTLPNGIQPIKSIINNFPESKIIVMDRELISLLFANAVRISSYNDSNKIYFNKILFNQKEFINKIKLFKKELAEISDNPNVLIVDFSEAMVNTDKVMKDIATFLNIEFIDILSSPSICGKIISNTKYPIIGQINDDPYKSLSKYFYIFTSYKMAIFTLDQTIHTLNFSIKNIFSFEKN